MPRKKKTPNNQVEELLSKLVAISLWRAGATQDVIAERLNKGKAWVNQLLQGVPKPAAPKYDRK